MPLIHWTNSDTALGLVAITAAGLMGHAFFDPRSQLIRPVIWHGRRDGPARVALTFDDGPSADCTPAILDVLGELDVKAAFFVVGLNARAHPQLVRRIAAENHLVGNHTFHHPYWGLFGAGGYWERELGRMDELMLSLIGRRPAFFRPPMGFKNWFLAQSVHRRGQVMITWTRRALDGLPTTAERIVRRLAPAAQAGDILALHDGVEPNVHRRTQQATVAALRPLIRGLRDRGLSLVRLDELIDRPAYLNTPTLQGMS